MNNSQSSDIFSETSVQFRDVSTIDIESYEALVLKIKSDVSYGIDGKTIKPLNNFPPTVDDCNSCVLQGLDIITYLLEDSALSVPKLCLYLEETVCVLQITSNLIKYIIETVAVTCCTMRTFPITTGNTILSVFSHCKESECIYGNHLRIFEKQLKDLFRNCHELQLTYLMALENHFIFDLTETEEQDVLMETLDINLKIGELVQALDVKTMAEQWKAYIMICEKYSNFLSNRDICNKTANVLVDIVRNNIKHAIEAREEDKVVIRSLKVASFSLKILLRLCKILKCISSTNYEHIVDILQEILLLNSTYYEITDKISPNILNIANTHLVIQSEAIISSLASDENFIKYINSIKFNKSKDEKMLQNILLVTAIMKTTCTQPDANEMSFNMIKLIISILPRCHKYLNMGIKFRHKKQGLFEHLLIHSLSASTSLNAQYYVQLENVLFEAILSTDIVCAVFCSNLWVLLCRSANSQLQISTLLALIQVYRNLEKNRIFQLSPQNINLRFTIENVFKILQYPEKLNIYKQFSIYEESNYDICCILKIRNLPDNLQISAKKVVIQKLLNMTEFSNENLKSEELKDMIKVLELSSTCEFSESDSRLEELLVNGWRKICPKTNNIKLGTNLDTGGLLYYRFLCALASLTESFYERITNRSNVDKIVHILSDTLLLGNVETITRLFKIYCKLILSQGEICVKETTIRTLKHLLEDEVQQYAYSVIISNEKFDNFFVQLFNKETNLQEAFNNYNKFKSMVYNDNDWQRKLLLAADNIYTHKCIQSVNVPKVSEILNNEYFDTDDFDTSFDIENDLPLNKRAKLDTDVANILERLESEVSKLCQIKESILNEQYKTRLRNVCDKLGKLT